MSSPIAPQVFAILRGLIEERIGIHYHVEDAQSLSEKLQTRALEAGFESLLDYYYYLRYDDTSWGEFSALVDTLVVNETYFFREHDQLQVIVEEFVAKAVKQGKCPRIWSSACSTGEEPYTVAMMLADRGLLEAVEIIGTDISERALARAKAGEFGYRSLRSELAASSNWLRVENGRPALHSQIKRAVTFFKLNLLDTAAINKLGKFELILCRNVLIYFSDDVIRKVIQTLSDALVPGGVLCVGVSESLMRFGGPLVCEEHRGVFVYRRPE
jgi:chemotaxis protein methyltransferase CheR